MNDFMVIFILAVVGVLSITAAATANGAQDHTKFIRIDNDCYLRVHYERHPWFLAAPDVTTRTTYCKEAR